MIIKTVHHDYIAGYVADEHIGHSTVTITGAGDLLTGQGGDITASRVFTLNNSDIDHDQLANTHNLTSDIDHTAISNIGSNSHVTLDAHLADNSQAHSDYLINNGNDETSGELTVNKLYATNSAGGGPPAVSIGWGEDDKSKGFGSTTAVENIAAIVNTHVIQNWIEIAGIRTTEIFANTNITGTLVVSDTTTLNDNVNIATGKTLTVGGAVGTGLLLSGDTVQACLTQPNDNLNLKGCGTGFVAVGANEAGSTGLRVYDGDVVTDYLELLSDSIATSNGQNLSITADGGVIDFDNENLTTTGIVTAGKFNTTGSVGNTGTLASFGLDGATPASFTGLLEVTTDSSHTMPSGIVSGILANVAFNGPDIAANNFGSGSFVTVTGAIASGDNVIGIFGNITGDATLTGGAGTINNNLSGVQFEVTNSADHILDGFGTTSLNTRGVFVTSNFSDTGFETSGTRAIRKNFGADITSNMKGLYDSTNDGSNFGVCITVTDSLDDASTGDITSIGLDITVPPSSTHGGGGVLTSLAARMGDGTNYSEFEADGSLIFHRDATVWDDLRIVPGQFQYPGVSDPTYYTWTPTGSGASWKIPKFNDGDVVYASCQMPHSWKLGSDFYFHIHWTPAERGNEESGSLVGWKVDYSATSIGDTFPIFQTVDLSDACTGVDDEHEFTSDVLVSGTGLGLSHVILLRIYRSDTGADDTWSGTNANAPGLLEFDIHFEKNRVGSREKLAA